MNARRCLVAVVTGLLLVPTLRADSYDWLAGTQWYVPTANLLAYLTPGTNLSNPLPISDQTLWDITGSAAGQFTGQSTATLTIGSSDTISTSSMAGIITPEGQVRIVFTPNGDSAGGPVTVGIGQVRDVGLGAQIEMQMLTGSESTTFATHWAYMTEIPAGPFTPPDTFDEGTLLSTEWAWTAGTTWNLSAPGVFGTSDAAQFSLEGYRNGYFWGTGFAPASAGGAAFTEIGSVTPEGNVLFNMLVGGTLTNLTGQIAGEATTGTMALRGYVGTDDFGDAATATVAAVPEPSTVALILAAGLLLLRFRRGQQLDRFPEQVSKKRWRDVGPGVR
ncbi:MAG: PEP-CTERM sorting domain-containing protein [Terrimicrobiaceae bacterium]